jgi:hypothetical protein
MNLYVKKPCEAIQFNAKTIEIIMKFLPEDRFVFFGIEIINGKEQKVFDDDLSAFRRVGGFLYYKKETKLIMEDDWILKRKDNYEILNNTYFISNFIQLPFLRIEDYVVDSSEHLVTSK